MDYEWYPVPQDSKRDITVNLYQTSTPYEVASGEGLSPLDLTSFVQAGKLSATECALTLTWHMELYGANQPKTGQVVEVKFGDRQYWVGIITQFNDIRLQSGTKSMQVVARTRDAMPKWRVVHRATDIYVTSTPINAIIEDLILAMGLGSDENLIPQLPLYTVHSNTQLADMTTWDMLETMLFAAGHTPFIDARGRLKIRNRDVTRPPDIVVENERLLNIQGSKSMPPITEFQVKWLDPALSTSSQSVRQLAGATVTAGFFQPKQVQKIKFSSDGTQRAKNTYMVIEQSANGGLLPVCDEDYKQTSQLGGKITLTTKSWVPALVVGMMVAKVANSNIPDGVASVGAGVTIPIGRVIEAVLDVSINLILASIGTGVYEIWGTPYDFVHWRNTTVAYNINANEWEVNAKTKDNDFIMSEDMAQACAIRELLYEVKSANSYNVTLVDDLRIEQGDILELHDGSKLYVLDFVRDLTFGAPATLQVTGFRI